VKGEGDKLGKGQGDNERENESDGRWNTIRYSAGRKGMALRGVSHVHEGLVDVEHKSGCY